MNNTPLNLVFFDLVAIICRVRGRFGSKGFEYLSGLSMSQIVKLLSKSHFECNVYSILLCF